jgi:hypothetical protein
MVHSPFEEHVATTDALLALHVVVQRAFRPAGSWHVKPAA